MGEVQSGEVTATYLRGANLLSTSTDDETSYYLLNAHGDVTALTSGAQTVTKSYDYDAFGNEKNPYASDQNPFRYCGEYFDKETGTYYFRARYYDPSIGRFTAIDPAKDGFNWYVYCYNNPLFYVDPSGLSGIMPDGTYYITHPFDEELLKLKQEYITATPERKKQILIEEMRIRKSGEEGIDWSVCAKKPLEHYFIDTDITDKLNNVMKTAEKENSWKRLNALTPFSNAIRYIDFALMVKPGGKYDLKSKSEWQGREHFIYEGDILWYDDPGNMLYGYLGKAIGFDDIILKGAAGAVQIITGTSNWDYMHSFFDDPRDQVSVDWGIKRYKDTHPLLLH